MSIEFIMSNISKHFDFNAEYKASEVKNKISESHFELLSVGNGFYAFDMGLHFFGFGDMLPKWHSIEHWNKQSGWRTHYPMLGKNLVFAETLFGDQFFYMDNSKIARLESETGHVTVCADNFDEWLDLLRENLFEYTDVDIAQGWMKHVGRLISPGIHLCPVIPFCLGGQINLENDAYECISLENMEFKGHLASQLSKLCPGDKIDLEVLNFPKNVSFI